MPPLDMDPDSFDTAERLAAIEARLAQLEAPREESRFLWIFSDWREMLKVVALPLTLLYGGLQFYDEVWTRPQREAAAEAASGQESLRELQAMNTELYRLNTLGEIDQAEAYMEANRGRISRLVAEATSVWQSQPDYFDPAEKQTLANALLSQGRNDLALEIGQGLAASAEGTTAQADAELFLGRVRGGEGPVQDLEAMRGHMQHALALASRVEPRSGSLSMKQQILVAWSYFELYEDTGCDRAEPIASALRDVTVPADDPVASVGDRMAHEQMELFAQRCASD